MSDRPRGILDERGRRQPAYQVKTAKQRRREAERERFPLESATRVLSGDQQAIDEGQRRGFDQFAGGEIRAPTAGDQAAIQERNRQEAAELQAQMEAGMARWGNEVGDPVSDFINYRLSHWIGGVPEHELPARYIETEPQKAAAAEAADAPIIDQAAEDEFFAEFDAGLNTVSNIFGAYQAAYNNPETPPEVLDALNEAYAGAQEQVERIDEQINRRLAAIEYGRGITGASLETADVTEADVHNAGLVPGTGGQTERQAEAMGATSEGGPETVAVGQAFESATQDAISRLPNEQGRSGPFSFVRGGAETEGQRRIQEDAMRDIIGDAEDLVIDASRGGGTNYQQEATNLANRAAEQQIDALGIGDERARLGMQIAFEGELRNEIDDLVAERRDIENEWDSVQASLQNEAQAQLDPQFNLNFDPTPEGAYTDAFQTHMDDWLDASGFEEDAPGQYALVMDTMTTLSGASPGVIALLEGEQTDAEADPEAVQAAQELQAQLGQLEQFGIDQEEALNQMLRARSAASRVYQDIQDLEGTGRIRPGSHAAAYAIYQSALPRMGEENAAIIANSPSFHQLINVASKGKAGRSKGATLRGIGALSERAYEEMGYNYEEIKGDTQAELEALVDYVINNYGGDPAAALEDYANSKSWGRARGEVTFREFDGPDQTAGGNVDRGAPAAEEDRAVGGFGQAGGGGGSTWGGG